MRYSPTRQDLTIAGISAVLLIVAVACILVSIFVVDTPSSATFRREAEASLSHNSVFTFNWAPAFCKVNPKAKGCSNRHVEDLGNSLLIHGLWPQPIQDEYCEVPEKVKQAAKRGDSDQLPPLDLSGPIKNRILPYYSHEEEMQHEWLKHGSCSGVGEDEYFQDIEALFAQMRTLVGPLFRDATGKTLKIETIQERFDSAYGKGAGKRVNMVCQPAEGISESVILEIRVSLPRVQDLQRDGTLQPLASLLKKAPSLAADCPDGFVPPANG